MGDKRKGKKRGAGAGEEEEEQMTKEQKAILHWLRKNAPVKRTKFMHSHVVEYFTASKAIDSLLKDSPWSKEKSKGTITFETREQCSDFMELLLRHKMFHRAKKIPVPEKEKKKKKEEEEQKQVSDSKQDDNKTEVKKRSKKKDKEEEKVEREKKKRKIRLEMHHQQLFLDGSDAYVWLYDPTPWYYYLAGGAIVLGIIAVCLFPLWPAEMRQGVYYISVAAAGFLVFIIVLAIIKYIIFCLLFIFTAGKLKFWIFPNLTEDVGFFESFWPVYVYTYSGPKKEKDSDDEDSSSEEEDDNDEKEAAGGRDEAAADGDGEGSETGRDDQDGGEQGSDSGGSSKEFEIIDNKDAS